MQARSVIKITEPVQELGTWSIISRYVICD
jgi:hypothetical protein